MFIKKFFLHHKKLAITLTTILSVVLVFILLCVSTYIPRSPATDYSAPQVEANQYIVEKTLVSAHRAGRNLAPENTMAAFKDCFENNNEYSVDVLEFDLHITKDKKLILLHDDTLDRTSDCVEVYGEKKVKPEDKTLGELQQYNMGYNFSVNGEYIYRGKSDEELQYCRIVTLDEVLDYILSQEAPDKWNKEFMFIIEIKNGKELGYQAADILYQTLLDKGIIDRTIVGTFKGEVSKYLDEHCPGITRSAGIAEVLSFYFTCVFGGKLDKVKYKVLQIPYKDFGINFGKKSIIDYAHYYGIAVQYWTINKAKDIEYLASIGADCIMSDDPRLAYQIICG